MPHCINDLKKTYKGDEPSPKGLGYCAHAEPIGKILIGKDGNIWQVKDSGKWSKVKNYMTHDNGSRPFLIIVEKDKSVKIYKFAKERLNANYNKKMDMKNYDELVGEYKYKKLIVGTSSGTVKGSDHTPQESKYFDGNSILLMLNNKDFIFIGHNIFKFTLENGDKFTKYYSLVGNNDVPYPVLVGDKNVYFLLEDDQSYIPKDKFPNNVELEDAYLYYYGHDRDYDKKKKKYVGQSLSELYSKKMKNIKQIESRY